MLSVAVLLLVSCGGGGYSGSPPPPPPPPPPAANACGEMVADPECHTLMVGGTMRAYLLHVPANFQANSSALVVGLHGSDGSGLRFVGTSQLNVKADQVGFAVAYPYALVSPGAGITEWNEFFNNSFGASAPDDSAFIRQLVTMVQASIHSDPKRTFVAGLSNGGFMAHRVGVEVSDLVAAIAVVEGTVVSPGLIQNAPAPLGPVSVLMLHGDQDQTVLYCGQANVASQEESFNYWSTADHRTRVNPAGALCDAQGNITAISEKRASGCGAGTEVQFYKLEGGTHQWYLTAMNVAGQTPFNPAFNSTTGVTTDDIIWNFFAAHPKP
jgi:polyhydroxybutyrate depolymerase